MEVRIIKVEALPQQVLKLTFSDGKQYVFDVKPLIGKGGLFEQVVIGPNGRSVLWPNGVDLCADTVRRPAAKTIWSYFVTQNYPVGSIFQSSDGSKKRLSPGVSRRLINLSGCS